MINKYLYGIHDDDKGISAKIQLIVIWCAFRMHDERLE